MSKDDSNKNIRKNSSNSSKKKKKRRKKIIRRRILGILSLIILFLVGIGGYYTFNILGNVNHKTISKSNEALGISQENLNRLKQYKTYKDVTNIALFGLDQRSVDEPSRSDAVMILSLDKAHKKIKLISVMRDSYVSIDGHGKDKLTHAYVYGGPELSIKTLNKNFKLNIQDYVAVNFFDMEKIIDSLGGVELTIKDYEVKEINKYIQELATITKTPYTPLKKSGVQTLTGRQALSYARIRSVGNGDFERTSRQRVVLESLFATIKKGGVLKFPSNVSKLSPMVQTSLSSGDMVKMGFGLFLKGTTNLETARFPVDGTFKDGGQMIKGVWYLPFDSEKNINALHKYIYEDVKPANN